MLTSVSTLAKQTNGHAVKVQRAPPQHRAVIPRPLIILRNGHGSHPLKKKQQTNNLEAGKPADCDSLAIKEAINNQQLEAQVTAQADYCLRCPFSTS